MTFAVDHLSCLCVALGCVVQQISEVAEWVTRGHFDFAEESQRSADYWTELAVDWGDSMADDLGHSLDHLRILTGEVCATCRSSDGEITPATEFAVPMYGPVEHLCAQHHEPEPPDQGEDDGPLTFAQRCEVDARDDWRMR